MSIIQNFTGSSQEFLKHAVQAVTKAPKAFVHFCTGVHIVHLIKKKNLKIISSVFFIKFINEKRRPFSMKHVVDLQRASVIYTI